MIKRLEFTTTASRDKIITDNPTFRVKRIERLGKGNWITLTDEPEINRKPPSREEYNALLARVEVLEGG